MSDIAWTDALAAGYIAGMIDGEGCVYYQERAGRMVNRRVAVAVMDKEMIDAYLEACDFLGIRAWYYLRDFPSWRNSGKPPLHEGGISCRSGFEDLLSLVPIVCVRKREKLEYIVDTYKQHQRPNGVRAKEVVGVR